MKSIFWEILQSLHGLSHVPSEKCHAFLHPKKKKLFFSNFWHTFAFANHILCKKVSDSTCTTFLTSPRFFLTFHPILCYKNLWNHVIRILFHASRQLNNIPHGLRGRKWKIMAWRTFGKLFFNALKRLLGDREVTLHKNEAFR